MSSKIAAFAAATAYQTVNGALRALAIALWPRGRPRDAQRVCVFRIGNVGDIACALPALRAIRAEYPGAHLTLLTSPGQQGMPSAADVLEGADWIDEILIYHPGDIDTAAKRWALVRRLRARRFDAWIDLTPDLATVRRALRDMAFTRLVAPRWARGWRIDTLRFAAQAQSEHLKFVNEVDRLLGIVRTAGMPVRDVDFGLPRPESIVKRVDAILADKHLASMPLVVLAPAAKRSTNLWVASRFAEVGRHLVARGVSIVLVGEKSDSHACREIAAQIGRRAVSLAGDITVAECSELLRRCQLAVCLDSGVQHLASAVGTPCVSLFSYWQMRGKWHPHGERNVIIQKIVPCHTCMKDACPYDNLCMKAIAADEVVAAASRFVPGAGAQPLRLVSSRD